MQKIVYSLTDIDENEEEETVNRGKFNFSIISRYKENTGCEYCMEDDPVALHFHHLDPSQKKFTIGNKAQSWAMPLSVLFEEIEKCIVVCANCHAKIHAGREFRNGEWYRDETNYGEITQKKTKISPNLYVDNGRHYDINKDQYISSYEKPVVSEEELSDSPCIA